MTRCIRYKAQIVPIRDLAWFGDDPNWIMQPQLKRRGYHLWQNSITGELAATRWSRQYLASHPS